MQVHKESIDKVPNALPNRGNIEIEIYGMEGIPPEDIKEHERQKNGGVKSDSEDEEPSIKKNKGDASSSGSHNVVMPPSMPPMGFPMMMPPYGMHPPGMPMMPPMMRPPLFPSAVSSSISIPPKPTFPAYSSATISAPPTTNTSSSNSATSNGSATEQPPAKLPISATGTSIKIMHPPEDASLEEIKARKPQYQSRFKTVQSPALTPTSTSRSTTPSSHSFKEQHRIMTQHEVSDDMITKNKNKKIIILI